MEMPMGILHIYRCNEKINRMELEKVSGVSKNQLLGWPVEKSIPDLQYAEKNGKAHVLGLDILKSMYIRLDKFNTPQHALISSLFEKQIMITSQFLPWYMRHGLEVENITAFVKYNPVAYF